MYQFTLRKAKRRFKQDPSISLQHYYNLCKQEITSDSGKRKGATGATGDGEGAERAGAAGAAGTEEGSGGRGDSNNFE